MEKSPRKATLDCIYFTVCCARPPGLCICYCSTDCCNSESFLVTSYGGRGKNLMTLNAKEVR